MKFSLIKIFVAITFLLYTSCYSQKIAAREFSLKLIENCLNSTKNSENFVIAPFEAFNLYKELFNIDNDDVDDDDDDEDISEDSSQVTTIIPAIRKQQKLLPSTDANLQDLISSISLTAMWSFNFQTRDTHKRTFYQHGTANQKMWVDFLRKDDTFQYAHDDRLNASILELPLNVKKIKLKLILPDQRETLPQLREYFLENIDVLNDLIKKPQKMTLVRVLLPKFHLLHELDLKEFFREISAEDVEKYHNIYQLSNLEFNERGIGRFERTTVLFWNAYSYLRVSPVLFDINHPFLFIITDKDGIQFFGQVVKMQS